MVNIPVELDLTYIGALVSILGFIILFRAQRFSNAIFAIRIRPGKVTVPHGKVPASFIADLKQIARSYPVKGLIIGKKENGEFRLVFPNSVPDAIQQRIRNVFPYDQYSVLARKRTNPDKRKSKSW